MVQTLAELRYGVVVHTRENSVKYGHNFNQTPYEHAQIHMIMNTQYPYRMSF